MKFLYKLYRLAGLCHIVFSRYVFFFFFFFFFFGGGGYFVFSRGVLSLFRLSLGSFFLRCFVFLRGVISSSFIAWRSIV